MNVLIDADGMQITTDDARQILSTIGITDVVETDFNGKNDILIAHDILDSQNKAWVVSSLENSCPDLVARALLSTEGIIVSSKQNSILPNHTVIVDDRLILTDFSLPNRNEGPGTGNWKEDVYLIVGERPGKALSLGKRDATFFSVNASSQWIRSEIFKLGFTAEDFYWINAWERGGVTETNWEFVARLKPKKIYACGKVASLSLTNAKIEHVAISHPQFWKRFHSKKEYPLITRLREELTLSEKNI